MTQNYAAIREVPEFEALVTRIVDTNMAFGIDIESGFDGPELKKMKLGVMHQHPLWKLVGFSLAAVSNPDAEKVEDKVAWARYIPVNHDNGGNITDEVATARALWRLLQTNLAVAHNLQFEYHGLARWFRDVLWDDAFYGASVRKTDGYFRALSDSLVEASLCALYPPFGIAQAIAQGPTGLGLKELTERVFKHVMVKFEDLWTLAEKKVTRSFANRDSYDPKVIAYACEDAKWCLALHLKHFPLVKDNLMFQYEIDLIPVLCRMEREGLMLDWDAMAVKAAEAAEFAELLNEDIQQELSDRLGRTISINLGSAPQLAKILFDELGLPIIKRSEKTGAASTDATSLAAISKKDKTVKRILQYREVQKLRNSYLDRYINGLNYREDARGIPNHNQLGAITGRFSVDGVSYQQWPKPYFFELNTGKTFKFNFRDTLLSPEGFRIVGYDFSQVELRMIAGIAGEEALIQSFLDGEDVHMRTAALMLKKPIEEISKKERAVGKTLNFAIVYGAGAARIANMLTTPEDPITTKMAQAMLDTYFKALPKIKKWLEDTRAAAHYDDDIHIVETPFGRKVRIWEYYSDNSGVQAQGDRLATNAPPQGGAADYMKIGMVRAQQAIDDAGMQDKIRMIMTVHDALEFYVHESVSTQDVIDLIGPAVTFGEETFPEIMAGYPPIKADWHEGYTWGGVFEIDLDVDGKICGYSNETEDKVKHYYTNFVNAVQGIEILPDEEEPQKVQPVEDIDTPMYLVETQPPAHLTDSVIFEFNDIDHAQQFYKYVTRKTHWADGYEDPFVPVFVLIGDRIEEVPNPLPLRVIQTYKEKFRNAGVKFRVKQFQPS